MKTFSLLAATACLAFAGSALARDGLHTLLVQLPDGSVEQIRYAGDVAPTVVYQPQVATVASPFDALDRVAEMMDAQMASMMRQAAAMTEMPVAFGDGSDVCVRSIRIVFTGGQPEMSQSTAGRCGARQDLPAAVPAAPRRAAGTILVDNSSAPRTVEVASR